MPFCVACGFNLSSEPAAAFCGGCGAKTEGAPPPRSSSLSSISRNTPSVSSPPSSSSVPPASPVAFHLPVYSPPAPVAGNEYKLWVSITDPQRAEKGHMVYCVDFVVHPTSSPELPALFTQFRALNIWNCPRHAFDDTVPLAPPMEHAWHEARLRWGWRLWRRFDTFRLLAGKIKETKGKQLFKELPEFPSKGNPITGMVKKKEQALQRVDILNAWINGVYSHPELLADSACRGFASEAVDHPDNIPANVIPERSAAAAAVAPDKVLSASEWLQMRAEAVSLSIEAKLPLEATFNDELKGIVHELQIMSVERQKGLTERKAKLAQNVNDLEVNFQAAQARCKAQDPSAARVYQQIPPDETEWQTQWQTLRKDVGTSITQADVQANHARAQMAEIMAQARALADSIATLRIQVNSELWWLLAWTGRHTLDPEAAFSPAVMPEDDEKRRPLIAKANIPTPNTPTLIPAGTRLTQRLRKVHHRLLDIRALKAEWDLAQAALLKESEAIKEEATALGVADNLTRNYAEEVATEERIRIQKEILIQNASALLDQIVEEDTRVGEQSRLQNLARVQLVPQRRQVRKSLQTSFQECLTNVMSRLKGQTVRAEQVSARLREQTAVESIVLFAQELERDAEERAKDRQIAMDMREAQTESTRVWNEQSNEGVRALAENDNGIKAARSSLNCVHAGLRLSALLGVGDGIPSATSFLQRYGNQGYTKPQPLSITSPASVIQVSGTTCPSCQTLNSGAFCLACGKQLNVPASYGVGIEMVDSGAMAPSAPNTTEGPCAACPTAQPGGYCLQCGRKKEVPEPGSAAPLGWLPSMTGGGSQPASVALEGQPQPVPTESGEQQIVSAVSTESKEQPAAGSRRNSRVASEPNATQPLKCGACNAVADASLGSFCVACGAPLLPPTAQQTSLEDPPAPPPPPPQPDAPPSQPDAPPSPHSASSLAHSLSSIGHERGSMDLSAEADLPIEVTVSVPTSPAPLDALSPVEPTPQSSFPQTSDAFHPSERRSSFPSQSHLTSPTFPSGFLQASTPTGEPSPAFSSSMSQGASSSSFGEPSSTLPATEGAADGTAPAVAVNELASPGLTMSLVLTSTPGTVILEEKEDDSAPDNTIITQACEALAAIPDPVPEDKLREVIQGFAPEGWSNDPWIMSRAIGSVQTMRKQLALREDLKSLLENLNTTQEELDTAQGEITQWESMLSAATQGIADLLRAVDQEQQQAEAERVCVLQKRRNAQEHLDRANVKLQTILPQVSSRETGMIARRTAAESRAAMLTPANAEATRRQDALAILSAQQAARMEEEIGRLTKISNPNNVILWGDLVNRGKQRSETVLSLQDGSRSAEEQLRCFETASEGANQSKLLAENSLAEVNALCAVLSTPDMIGSEAERYSPWELQSGIPIAINTDEHSSLDAEFLVGLRKLREALHEQAKSNLQRLAEEKQQLETELSNTAVQIEMINKSLASLRQEGENRARLMQDLGREAETVSQIQAIVDSKCLDFSKAFAMFQGRVSTVEVALQGGVARRENQAHRGQAMQHFHAEGTKLDPQQNVANMSEVQGMQQANATDKQSLCDFSAISSTATKSLQDLSADLDAWAATIIFEGEVKELSSVHQRTLRDQYESRASLKEQALVVTKQLQDELPRVAQEQAALVIETQKLQELTEMYRNLPPLKPTESVPPPPVPEPVVHHPAAPTNAAPSATAPSAAPSATAPSVQITPPPLGHSCTQCGATGQTGSFCLKCGSTVGSGPRCEYCGAGSQVGPSCTQCGKILKSAVSRVSTEVRASAGSVTAAPPLPTTPISASAAPPSPVSTSRNAAPSSQAQSYVAPSAPYAPSPSSQQTQSYIPPSASYAPAVYPPTTCFQCGTPGQSGFCQQCGVNVRAGQQPLASTAWMCTRCGVAGQMGGFCSGCGGPRPPATPTTNTCSSCKTPNQSGAFCMICGTRLAPPPPPVTQISDACSNCGATGQVGTACALCGTPRSSTPQGPRPCPGCAAPNQAGAFCLHCGFKLNPAAAPPVIATPKPPVSKVCQGCGKSVGDKAFCLYCGKKQ